MKCRRTRKRKVAARRNGGFDDLIARRVDESLKDPQLREKVRELTREILKHIAAHI